MKLTPFGLYVRTLRLELGLTLKTMADALKVSPAYLSSIELGDRPLPSTVAEEAIKFFSPQVRGERIEQLKEAIDKSANAVPIGGLESEEKVLVAAFARRLTEGEGVPDEVLKWLKKGGNKHGGTGSSE